MAGRALFLSTLFSSTYNFFPALSSHLSSQGALVHDMRYLASVVTQTFSAFGDLLALPKRFAELGGGVARVAELLEAARAGAAAEAAARAREEAAAAAAPGADEAIEFAAADVATPGGKLLARALTARVGRGGSLLVTGPNGAGKTSLVRVLAGLWPLAGGAARRPGRPGDSLEDAAAAVFYVPQKPYTTLGTLREQVVYPLTAAAARRRHAAAPDPAAALEAELDAIVGVVRLTYLVAREGGWSAIREWGEALSLGEQQRLGMARLFFHRPRFGVLDEATNATSVDVEEALYAHAAALGCTLVTITQRAALERFHGRELRLLGDGAGAWELREVGAPPAEDGA
jgi:ABC-type uncharacterized transport system fused permease/ATPase subunit